jgi:hypothetical protein
VNRAFPPETAASRRRVRRYAVPGWMIERAAERRLAGDWRGACAAANIDVAFDLDSVKAGHGAEVATALADDLRHLVPDLVRWQLPRVLGGRSTLAPHPRMVLARYDADDPSGASLYVQAPSMVDGPQRARLAFGLPPDARTAQFNSVHRKLQDWTDARHLWDVRRTPRAARPPWPAVPRRRRRRIRPDSAEDEVQPFRVSSTTRPADRGGSRTRPRLVPRHHT